jgi:hypothetical protein
MKTDKLIEQLELYSNSVVGFTVVQSIAFSFTFGTNADFSCKITSTDPLWPFVAAHFVLTIFLAAWALLFLQRRIVRLSGENEDTLRVVYFVKIFVVTLFAAIPVALLLFFGLIADSTKGRCEKAATNSSMFICRPVSKNASVPMPPDKSFDTDAQVLQCAADTRLPVPGQLQR